MRIGDWDWIVLTVVLTVIVFVVGYLMLPYIDGKWDE